MGKDKGKRGNNGGDGSERMKRKDYEEELHKLQVKLCHLQEWIKKKGLRVIIAFEGRDAAGKGGTIRAITERVSPRVFRIVALPAPSERQKTQLFLQRYIEQFPAAGEVVIFDAGIILIKFWLEVGKEEQERRFQARINDPLRQWKLSPMDIDSYTHWDDYSKARDMMLETTDSEDAPWYVIRSDDKRRARLNCISHILSTIPHKKINNDKVKLPKRPNKNKYDDQRGLKGRNFVRELY